LTFFSLTARKKPPAWQTKANIMTHIFLTQDTMLADEISFLRITKGNKTKNPIIYFVLQEIKAF